MSMTQLLFSFHGRLNRKPYWMTVVAMAVIIIPLVLLALVVVPELALMLREQRFELAEFPVTILIPYIILNIPLLWISLATGAKRLHDRDKSAWCSSSFTPCRESWATLAVGWRMWDSSSCSSSASPSPFGASSRSVACAGR